MDKDKKFDFSSVNNTDIQALIKTTDDINQLSRSTTQSAIMIGQLLKDAKEWIPHGLFTLYCIDAVDMSIRLAQIYISIARLAEREGLAHVEKLPLQSAVRLSAKSAPPGVVRNVIDRVKAGDVPHGIQINAQLKEARADITHANEKRFDLASLSATLKDRIPPEGLKMCVNFFRQGSAGEMRELGQLLNMARGLPMEAPVETEQLPAH